MNEQIREIEAKMPKSGDKPPYEFLTKEEREMYADFLASRKHFRSAILFTTDEAKKESFEGQKLFKYI